MSSSQSQNHDRVWDTIFDNDQWLSAVTSDLKINPILMGPGVREYYEKTCNLEQPSYMALLACDPSGDIVLNKKYHKLLFQSLKRHTLNKKTYEVKFPDNNITLNVHDAIRVPEIIQGKPSKLFDISHADPICWFVFWEDSRKKLRCIAQGNTISLNGVVKRMKDVGSICALYLERGSQLKRGSQEGFVFEDPIRKNLNITPNKDGNRITGWKVRD